MFIYLHWQYLRSYPIHRGDYVICTHVTVHITTTLTLFNNKKKIRIYVLLSDMLGVHDFYINHGLSIITQCFKFLNLFIRKIPTHNV